MSSPAPALECRRIPHPRTSLRPQVRGKFLFIGEEKLYVRGVTYGPFCSGQDGTEYPNPARVAEDFEAMVAAGINTIRTYSVPPIWFLDAAQRANLRVMVGLPWEQHVTFLDDSRTARAIEGRIREAVRKCAGHPAVLSYAVGNEIPAGIVRWLGRRRVERFIEKLYRVAKAEDPEALVTYVNFPHSKPTLHVCKPLLGTAHCCWRRSVWTADETVSKPKLIRLNGKYGVFSQADALEYLSFPGRMNGIEVDTRSKTGILGSHDVTEAQNQR